MITGYYTSPVDFFNVVGLKTDTVSLSQALWDAGGYHGWYGRGCSILDVEQRYCWSLQCEVRSDLMYNHLILLCLYALLLSKTFNLLMNIFQKPLLPASIHDGISLGMASPFYIFLISDHIWSWPSGYQVFDRTIPSGKYNINSGNMCYGWS